MLKLQIAILSVFLTPILIGSGLSPILPELAIYIGKDGEFFAKMFLTLPSLVVVPFLFVASILPFYFNKKSLMLLGLLLYIISGIGGLFFSYDKFSILAFRFIGGVGAGLVVPYSTSLFVDYFNGPKRDKMIGYGGVLQYVGGISILIMSGYLAHISWRLSFLVFSIAFIPLILLYKFLPSESNSNLKHKYPMYFSFVLRREVWLLCFYYFLSMTLLFMYFSNISFVIKYNNLGGPVVSSYAQSLFMLAGIVSNILMPILKKYSILLLYAIQYGFVAIGFITISVFVSSIWGIFIGSIFLGLGFGSLGNAIIANLSEYTSKINRIGSLAVFFSAMYMGQFLSPIFGSVFRNILHLKNADTIFLFNGGLLFVVSLFLFIKYLKSKILKCEGV
jgi:MFS family permease